MLRYLAASALACACLLGVTPVQAAPTGPVPGVTTGSLVAVADKVQISLGGQASSVGLSLTAVNNVTLVVEGSVDGVTWTTLTGTVVGGASTATSFNANGQWTFNTGGLAAVRARETVAGASPAATVLFLGAPSIAGLSSAGGGSSTANQGTPNPGGGQAWPVAASPAAVTPTVPTTTLATGGAAQTITVTHGGYICNPLSATDQGVTVEVIYINPVTTATAAGNAGTSNLAAGQCFNFPPGMTTSVSWIAATTGHKINAVVW